jgi:isocitrate dehydrogenase (NAD+)
MDVANPTAMILSSTWLLRHLHLDKEADVIANALYKTIRDGKVRTRDLGGSAHTTEFTKQVIKEMETA